MAFADPAQCRSQQSHLSLREIAALQLSLRKIQSEKYGGAARVYRDRGGPFDYCPKGSEWAHHGPGTSTSWISDWMNAEYGVELEEKMRLVIGFSHTAFPADLRTWAEIKTDEKENLNKKS
jgi:hypothetical protein